MTTDAKQPGTRQRGAGTRVTSLSVRPADLERWKQAAVDAGLPLSQYIARAVDAQLEQQAG